MANEQNLVQNNPNFTREQVEEIRRKGGQRSAEVKKKKAALRDVTAIVLGSPAPMSETAIKKLAKQFGVPEKDITVQFIATLEQGKRAMKGDRAALEYLRDTAGERPKDSVEMDMRLPVFFKGEDELEE